jgi:hypothetical protein
MMAAIRDQLRGKASAQRAAMEAAQARAQQISDELRKSDRPSGPITPEEMRAVMRPLIEAGAFGDEENVLNLQKSWHTLHYLLTGSAEPVNTPLGQVIFGGSDVGPEAIGIYACDSEDELPLALDYFEQLKRFYTESAARGCALLSYLK